MELPTEMDIFFARKVFPQIAKFNRRSDGHMIIEEWKPGTPDYIKKKAEQDKEITVTAN